uniref:Peptidase A3A domain-containing protein n=1 Tax=Cacopsylla melanoneura TaxID=428564 RepID=A0A8D8QGN1_9HEMI
MIQHQSHLSYQWHDKGLDPQDDECIFTSSVLKNRRLHTLIDTGAGLTVVEKQFVDSNRIEPFLLKLTAANGTDIQCIGVVSDLEIVINNHTFMIDVLAVEHLSGINLVLGRDFLKHYKAKIDFELNETFVKINNKIISLSSTVEKSRATPKLTVDSQNTQNKKHFQKNKKKNRRNRTKKKGGINNDKPITSKEQVSSKPPIEPKSEPMRKSKFVYSSEDYIIPPKSECKIKCATKFSSGGTFMVNQNFVENRALYPLTVEFDQKPVEITFINPSPAVKFIYKNELIGNLTTEKISSPLFYCMGINEKYPKTHVENVQIKNLCLDNPFTDLSGNIIDINPEMPVEKQLELRKLLNNYLHCFAKNSMDFLDSKMPPYTIQVEEDIKPINSPPYKLCIKEREILDSILDELLDQE